MSGFIRSVFFGIVTFFFCQISFAVNQCCYEVCINKLLRKNKEDLNIGIVISDPKTGRIIYQKNPNHYFVPASSLKLLTAYTALKRLSPDYHFQTSLLTDLTKLNNGILDDNLVVKFDGDPTLTSNDLEQLFQDLKNKGVNRINGKIIVQETPDDAQPWPQGISHDDLKFCYAAPISSIIIDENCVAMNVVPHDQHIELEHNQPLFVDVDKMSLEIGDKDEVELFANENNNYHLLGKIKSPLHLNIAIQNNHLYAKKFIYYLLQKNNILHSKAIEFSQESYGSNEAVSHQSQDLAAIIRYMLKESNNCVANAVFKKLASTTSEQKASWLQAVDIVKKDNDALLQNRDIKIYEGAGISRYDLITPKHLIKILHAIYGDNRLRDYFLTALPISGVDGTLKDRMQNLKGKVIAKTGSFTGISALTGYIKTKQNRVLAFAIMINNGISDNKDYKDLEDKLCKIIYDIG